MKNKIIFKDELCNAKFTKKQLSCIHGILKFTGDNIKDFELYRIWCKDCDKIKIIDRKELEKVFKCLSKKIDKELCIE